MGGSCLPCIKIDRVGTPSAATDQHPGDAYGAIRNQSEGANWLLGVHQYLCKLLLFNTLQNSRWTVATKNGGVSMMYFISCCNSKCYENTDGQPGGHRSRRGRGPRMAWPPSAVLEGGAHKRSAVGRIAPKGRTSRGPLPAGDCPTGESEPFRPDTLQLHPAVT